MIRGLLARLVILAAVWALLLLFLFLGSSCLQAAAQDAVVRIGSHGGSGTVIFTTAGRSLILSCAHAFQGNDRSKAIVIDVPTPTPGPAQRPGVRLLAVDYRADLSLIEMLAGPLPYVCPVAPVNHRAGRLLSVGFDEMALPAKMRPATSLGSQGAITFTRERPWHGRSGGGLIDLDSGYLVGVVQGYSGPQDRREVVSGCTGMYASLTAIQSFLSKNQPGLQAQPATDNWDGSYRLLPEYVQTPGAPRVYEGRQQACPPGFTCPPGAPCLPGG